MNRRDKIQMSIMIGVLFVAFLLLWNWYPGFQGLIHVQTGRTPETDMPRVNFIP